MRIFSTVVWSLGLLGACVDEVVPEEAAELVDAKGNRWRLRGPAPVAVVTDEAVPDRPREAELAAALRPVAWFDGNEYELVASDEEILARHAALAAHAPVGGHPQRPHAVAQPTEAEPMHIVFGGESRIPIAYANVRYYPSSAVGVSVSMANAPWWDSGGTDACTLTMIGPSTAISAAHCFYRPNVGWHPVKSWSFGVSSLFQVGRNQAWPTYTGCYWVTIPSGATTSGSAFYDYAVIEFSNSQAPTCNLFPGNTLGWYGWWTASDAQIRGSNVRINGYPSSAPGGTNYVWPSQFTQGDFIGALSVDATSYLLRTQLDISGGNSGSGVAQELFAPGDRYLTGIVVGELPEANFARRIDSTVRSFVLAYSAL